MFSACPPSSIQISGRSASSACAIPTEETVSAKADADVSSFQRMVARLSLFSISSLIIFPSPVFRDANPEQPRVRQEHIGRQATVITVQKVAGDGRDVEHVLEIAHHLPAIGVGEDQ